MVGMRRLHTRPARRIRSVARSAQRHQGGARRAGDSRGAECAAGLIPRSSREKQVEIANDQRKKHQAVGVEDRVANTAVLACTALRRW